MGLKEIIDDIRKDAQAGNETLVNENREKTRKMIEEKKDELDKLFRKKREVLDTELMRRERKQKAKAEMEAQREKFRLENHIVDSIIHQSYLELQSSIEKDKNRYVAFLAKLIDQAATVIREDEITVKLNARDANLINEIQKKTKIKIKKGDTLDILGGVVCCSDQLFVDSSLERIFEESKPEFVKLILSELDKS